MKLIALTFVCFLSDVLCKNETFLKTADKAQKRAKIQNSGTSIYYYDVILYDYDK